MKVSVNWGARNISATFPVKATDLEGARDFLRKRDEWGLFHGHFDYTWKDDAQNNVYSVSIAPTFTITMPSWAAYRDQPQICKDAWDTMWRALREHEDGHRALFEPGLTSLVSRLEALETLKGHDLDELMKGVKSDMQAEQDKYDTETDHGASKGVELIIAQQCRSKSKAD